MISMKEFLKNEKQLHEEAMLKRKLSFKDFNAILKAEEAHKIDIAALSQSLKEFIKEEEMKANKF